MKPSNPYLGALPLRTSRISSIDVDGKAWDSVLFQQSKSILDFDLNVMQRILQENIAQLSRSIFYSGFTRSSSLTADSNNVYLAVSRINALGNIIRLIDTNGTDGRISIPISYTTNVNTSQYSRIFLWIEIWFQEIIPTTISESFDGSSPVEFKSSVIPYGGGVQNNSTLTNELYDPTFGSETTRRIQTRWRIRQTPAIDPTPVVAEASSISVTANQSGASGTIVVPNPTNLSGTITAAGNTVKMYGVNTSALYPKMILVQTNTTGGNFGSATAGTTATIVSVDKLDGGSTPAGVITIKANGTSSCAVGSVSFTTSGYMHGTTFVVPPLGSQKLITANTTYGFPSETTLGSKTVFGVDQARSDSYNINFANNVSYVSSRLSGITVAASSVSTATLYDTYAYKLSYSYTDISENESLASMTSNTVSNFAGNLANTGLASTTYSNKITWTASTSAKQYYIYRNIFRGQITSIAGNSTTGAVYTLANTNSYALPIGTKVTTTGASVSNYNVTDGIVTASTTNTFTIGSITITTSTTVTNGVAKPDSLPFSSAQLIDTIILSAPATTNSAGVVASGMTATIPASATSVTQSNSAALLNAAGTGSLYSLTGINTTLLKPGMIISSTSKINSGTHRILSITTSSSTNGTVLCYGTSAPTTTGSTATITDLSVSVDANTPVYYDNINSFSESPFTKPSTITVQAVYPTNVAPFETISGSGGDPRVFAQGGRIEVILTGSISASGVLTVAALNTNGYLQVGQRITGIGVPDNVFITGITTAFSSSGNGTYTVSGISSAISSTTLYAWFTPSKTFQRSSKVTGFTELYDPYVYVAGDGSSSDASVLNTVDGRVYGLPLAYVYKDDSSVVLTDLRNVINSLNTGTINATTDITTTNPISGLALRLAASSTGTSLTVSGGGSTNADLSLTPKGSGVVSVATSLAVPAGTATLPSYSFAGQSSTGLYYSLSSAGVSQIGLSVGGTPVVTVSPLSTVFASTLTSAGIVTGTAFSSTGLEGGSAGRYLGRTSNGAPSNGTYSIGDYVVDTSGYVRVYNGTAWIIAGANAGDPNTWSGLQSFVRSSLNISSAADTVVNTTIGPGSATIAADLSPNYVSGARFVSPTYSNNGTTKTIGSAVNVDIANLPIAATNVSITNSYGLRITGTATNATNAYSLYVSGSTGSTLSYAMYVASGLSYFADNVTIAKITKITDSTDATSTTADAALVISGGLAVAKKLYAGSLYGPLIGTVGAGTGNANTGAFTTLTTSDTTEATNTSTASVAITGGLAVAKKIFANQFNGPLVGAVTGNVTGNVTGLQTYTIAAGSTADLISATMATSDFFRIRVGGSADAGYAEIATADNGSEPIHVRQYTWGYLNGSSGDTDSWKNPTRTATLLDASGNTSFPGTLSADKMSGGAAPRCFIPAGAFTSLNATLSTDTTTGQYQWTFAAANTAYVYLVVPANYGGGTCSFTIHGTATGNLTAKYGTTSAADTTFTSGATILVASTAYYIKLTCAVSQTATLTGMSIVFG